MLSGCDVAVDVPSYPLVQFPDPQRDFGLGSPMECSTPDVPSSPDQSSAAVPASLSAQLLQSPVRGPMQSTGGMEDECDMWDDLDELGIHVDNIQRAEEQR